MAHGAACVACVLNLARFYATTCTTVAYKHTSRRLLRLIHALASQDSNAYTPYRWHESTATHATNHTGLQGATEFGLMFKKIIAINPFFCAVFFNGGTSFGSAVQACKYSARVPVHTCMHMHTPSPALTN